MGLVKQALPVAVIERYHNRWRRMYPLGQSHPKALRHAASAALLNNLIKTRL